MQPTLIEGQGRPIETVEQLESVRSKLLEAEIDVAAVTPVEETPLP